MRCLGKIFNFLDKGLYSLCGQFQVCLWPINMAIFSFCAKYHMYAMTIMFKAKSSYFCYVKTLHVFFLFPHDLVRGPIGVLVMRFLRGFANHDDGTIIRILVNVPCTLKVVMFTLNYFLC